MSPCPEPSRRGRDFLKLSALFTSSFGAAIAADNWNLPVNANANDQPVKIGYLPITDAAPLLVAHSRKLYQAEGLTTEQPRLSCIIHESRVKNPETTTRYKLQRLDLNNSLFCLSVTGLSGEKI
ncbi:ABC transporter substrate-binding protein, partial [Microcystis aeruginosa]|uniref:ABC transporter substrate-binding protein n=1 Tax=Microcystis aeruginosa TaxID=1126 RepID=UPI001D13F167